MKVRLRQTMAGPGGVYFAGDVADVDESTGLHLLESRQAEPFEGDCEPPAAPGPETAEAPDAGETADADPDPAKKTSRKRRN